MWEPKSHRDARAELQHYELARSQKQQGATLWEGDLFSWIVVEYGRLRRAQEIIHRMLKLFRNKYFCLKQLWFPLQKRRFIWRKLLFINLLQRAGGHFHLA